MDLLQFAQHQQWHDVFISGPTRNVVGLTSNDFPGFYYFDPRNQIEYVGMFEGKIDWRAARIERRIVEIGRTRKETHLHVGLFSEKELNNSVKFYHWNKRRILLGGIKKEHRDVMPGQWEALNILITQSFQLLKLPDPQREPDWEVTARNCLKTLERKRCPRVFEQDKLWIFFETFDSNSSTYELEPKDTYKGSAELIAQAGLASSLLNYAELKPRDADSFYYLGCDLASTLHLFYDTNAGIFQNTYPPKSEEWSRGVIDTWYTFHNHYHVLRSAYLTNDNPLLKKVMAAIDRLIAFVRNSNYHIPLFAKLARGTKETNLQDGSVIGFAHNPSVLGMYAFLLTEAAMIFKSKSKRYMKEARKALEILHRYPLFQIFHQTIQLSWAAAACNRLGLKDWRDDFTRCLLLNCYRQEPIAGLFQGCCGLSYPSFRETVEAVTPWIEWIDDPPSGLPLMHIIKLVFQKAEGFISQSSEHAGLPQEGCATIEQPEAGRIGIAIYATPQVFDLACFQRRLMKQREKREG